MEAQHSRKGKQLYENRDSFWSLLTKITETLRSLNKTRVAFLSRPLVHVTSRFFLDCCQLLWAPPGTAFILNLHDLLGVTFATPGCEVPAWRVLAVERTAAQGEDLLIRVTHFGGG